jgi:hypothetical protein
MESRPSDRHIATDHGDYYTANRRTLEFLILAGILGLGTPIAVLMGAQKGERTAIVIYPGSGSASGSVSGTGQ